MQSTSIVNEGDEEDKIWSGKEVLVMQRQYPEGVYDAGLEMQGLVPPSTESANSGGFGFPSASPAKSTSC